MMPPRAALPWLCATALIACATAPTLRSSDGDGDGIPDDVDLCPDRAEDVDGVDDRDGCPEFPAGYDANAPANEPLIDVFGDADGDGIDDGRDACPNEAEDKDQFDDKDGCPELDNDLDRILDADDKCPNEPETYNNVADDDGCPDRAYVIIRPREPRGQLARIFFRRQSSQVDPSSGADLDLLASVLTQYRCVVEVQGHAAANEPRAESLGAARADAVRAALMQRGVAPEQLVARSYGASQPYCSQKGEECDSLNRRVGFLIDRSVDVPSCPK